MKATTSITLDESSAALFGRHLIGFYWNTDAPMPGGIPDDDGKRHVVISCTVIEIRGCWLLLTAGHIISNMLDFINKGYSINSPQLMDCWNANAKDRSPIPFIFDRRKQISLNYSRDGTDFAILHIDGNTRSLLESNGIAPISSKQWMDAPDMVHAACMLGFPTHLQNVGFFKSETVFTPCYTMAPLETVTRDDVPNHLKCKSPSLHFRVTNPPTSNLHPADEPFDIDGMSGGPVIGIGVDEAGKLHYSVVGVQVAWDHNTRVTRAISIAYVGRLVEAMLREAERAPQTTDS